ncbi:MAG: hypothetical protein K2W85_13915 [Phycisphaerales bacterium]|nr:hypothetical protein [Phycisphaerales bacterium]
MAKRRQPPLFEVLGGADRRSMSARPLPVQVRIPPAAPPAPAPAPSPAPSPRSVAPAKGKIVLNPAAMMLILAGVLLLGFTVWYLAFRMGENAARDDKTKEIEKTFPPPPVTPPGPLVSDPNPAPAPAPNPGGDPAPSADDFTDPRVPGVNYLNVENLVWKDAERAVAFLAKGGIPAKAVPFVKGKSKVDPKQARDKNLPHVIFVLEGIPSGQYKASENRRNELVEKVRRLGKRWQAEEKGPSDFASPYWAKFDG